MWIMLVKSQHIFLSCFADLTRQGIEHTLTRSLGGLQMNIEAIMLTHNLEVMGMLQTSN